jgi:transposase
MLTVAAECDIKQLRRDALDGRLSVEQLLNVIERQYQTIRNLRRDKQCLQEKLAQYEPDGRTADTDAEPATPTCTRPYSVEAESKRRRGRKRRRKSPGRRRTEEKFAAAQRTENLYPNGIRRGDCHLVRERAVWRLDNGKAVRVGYRIFAGPDGQEARIPGVTPRCEYGIEILVVLAFLVYIIGMSFDKACAVLAFFCALPLSKSQADALLRQLARHWQADFDILCDLIAHAAVVAMDETGWKVGNTGCSLWAFASEWQRVFFFGCHKDDATLDQILPPEVFEGIGVSDDAAVYRQRFSKGQKCWAHLLRRAIRLAILYPRKRSYQRFLDQLLTLYRDAKRAAADGRLGDQGRRERVCDLENRLCDLCRPHQRATTAGLKPHERDFANLIDELLRLFADGELFTFVMEPRVEPTNNRLERLIRGSVQDRKAGRTNKTTTGAQRRSIIMSVLESLRANLKEFNMTTVLGEIACWLKEGVSLFARQWQALVAQLAAENTS